MSKALIFDCDGVLGDTEQFGHLPAFNQMWKEMGVPWHWSVEEYGRKLKIGGGKERMLSLFKEPAYRAAWPDAPAGEAAQKEMVAAWHKRKSAIYKEIILSGRIPPRSGVKRISEEALENGWTLAVASTSAEESVRAVLRHAMGEATANRFSLVLAGDCVKAKKPAPDIYLLAAERLGMSPGGLRGCRGFEQWCGGRRRSGNEMRGDGEQLHQRGGLLEGGGRADVPGRPRGRSLRGDRESFRGAA